VREAINSAEMAILLNQGLETAYTRIAELIDKSDKATEEDGRFLAQGRTLFPNNGWVEIGQAKWAHKMNDFALALKILGDVSSRAAALTPEEIDRARELQKDWSPQEPMGLRSK
jgi:hypothetical protein